MINVGTLALLTHSVGGPTTHMYSTSDEQEEEWEERGQARDVELLLLHHIIARSATVVSAAPSELNC